MKEGRPIPIRFPIGDEKSIRIFAIASDKTFSAAVRELCRRGLAVIEAESAPPEQPRTPTRRVLSRGVGP